MDAAGQDLHINNRSVVFSGRAESLRTFVHATLFNFLLDIRAGDAKGSLG